jgi:hypothetical protein
VSNDMPHSGQLIPPVDSDIGYLMCHYDIYRVLGKIFIERGQRVSLYTSKKFI